MTLTSNTEGAPSPSRHPRVSVLINNYNNEAYLRRCIDSVIGQTTPPDEIIICDDQSSDGSREIIDSYGDRLTRLTGSHESRVGRKNQAKAIADAFMESSGAILFLLDGDDVFLPQKIAAYLEAFAEGDDVVMVQSPLERIDAEDRRIGFEVRTVKHEDDVLDDIYAQRELDIYYPTSALAFRRDYLELRLPLTFEDGLAISADCRLALLAPLFGRTVTLRRAFTQYRRHPKAVSIAHPYDDYKLARDKYAYFNWFCAATGRRQISRWRSQSFRKVWLRHRLTGFGLMPLFRAIRWRLLSRERRIAMEHLVGSA